MPLASRKIYKHVTGVTFNSVSIPGVQSVELTETVEHVGVKAQNAVFADERIVTGVEQTITVETQDIELYTNTSFDSGDTGTLVWVIKAHSSGAADQTFTVTNCTLVGLAPKAATGAAGGMTLTFATHSDDGTTNPVSLA